MAKNKEPVVVEDALAEKSVEVESPPVVVEDDSGVPYCVASRESVFRLWDKYGAPRVKALRSLTIGEIEARLRSK